MRDDELEGKVALVTGSSRGLGRGIAQGLARHGADLVLTSRKLELNEELAAEIEGLGRKVLALKTDIQNVAEISETVQGALAEFGRIDILVNNAGTSPVYTSAVNVEEWAWDKILDTNLKGLFFFATAVAKHMMERKKGKIINITSAAGSTGSPMLAPYAASKAAVTQLTRTLALELAPCNINVNAIGPSFFEVGVSEPILASKEMTDIVISKTPLGRIGKIDDLIGAVVFLSTEDSDFITGQTLYVDGGWTA
jgi:NAD(P)-dependent dehydrogenase (short-subunit alcohol dehydrogenase family)